MNENKTLRFWKLAVILLILCNVTLISVIWLHPHLPFGQHPEQPRDFAIRQLNFSADQVKKYDVLIQDHQKSMQQLRREAAECRKRLFDNLTDNEKNTVTPDSLAQLIANNQKQIELVTYNHFAAVRNICTSGQKAQFDKIIGDVTKMMNGGRGNRQNPPPPDSPPPPNQR